MRGHIGYYQPKTVAEAVALLREHSGHAGIICGGTDIMVDVRSGKFTGDCLVDISRVAELKEVREEGEAVSVGAGVTIEEMRTHPLIVRKLPALAMSGTNFASRQIRNRGTIGGNIAHASPSGDTQPPFVLYDGLAVVAGPDGESRRPLSALVAGANKSALKDTELVTRFVMKPAQGGLQSFEKVGRRKDLAISRVSLAVLADLDGSGKIGETRVVLGACMPCTARMPKTEDFLRGKKPALQLFKDAGKLMSEEMIAVTGRRKSLAYKEPAIAGLLVRMLLPLLNAGGK